MMMSSTHPFEHTLIAYSDIDSVLKQKATGTDEDNYFYDAMLDIYAKALEMKPSRSMHRSFFFS